MSSRHRAVPFVVLAFLRGWLVWGTEIAEGSGWTVVAGRVLSEHCSFRSAIGGIAESLALQATSVRTLSIPIAFVDVDVAKYMAYRADRGATVAPSRTEKTHAYLPRTSVPDLWRDAAFSRPPYQPPTTCDAGNVLSKTVPFTARLLLALGILAIYCAFAPTVGTVGRLGADPIRLGIVIADT